MVCRLYLGGSSATYTRALSSCSRPLLAPAHASTLRLQNSSGGSYLSQVQQVSCAILCVQQRKNFAAPYTVARTV